MRHEGGTPSNNLIKDVPHRATVFVGPTLKSMWSIYNKYGELGCLGEIPDLNGKRFDSATYYIFSCTQNMHVV